MRKGNLNEHGQPYSKKQRKASRHMMAMRNNRSNAPAQSRFNISKDMTEPGLLAGIMAALFMGRRRGS